MLSHEPVPWLLWTVSVVVLLKMLIIQANHTKGEVLLNAQSKMQYLQMVRYKKATG